MAQQHEIATRQRRLRTRKAARGQRLASRDVIQKIVILTSEYLGGNWYVATSRCLTFGKLSPLKRGSPLFGHSLEPNSASACLVSELWNITSMCTLVPVLHIRTYQGLRAILKGYGAEHTMPAWLVAHCLILLYCEIVHYLKNTLAVQSSCMYLLHAPMFWYLLLGWQSDIFKLQSQLTCCHCITWKCSDAACRAEPIMCDLLV